MGKLISYLFKIFYFEGNIYNYVIINKNMKIWIILISCMLLLSTFVYADEAFTVHVAYCDHMGYEIKLNEDNVPLCNFGDENPCTTWDFYSGICRQDKVDLTKLRDREKGEFVYTEFENCKEGLVPGEQKYLLEPPKCVNPNSLGYKLNKIWNMIFS